MNINQIDDIKNLKDDLTVLKEEIKHNMEVVFETSVVRNDFNMLKNEVIHMQHNLDSMFEKCCKIEKRIDEISIDIIKYFIVSIIISIIFHWIL